MIQYATPVGMWVEGKCPDIDRWKRERGFISREAHEFPSAHQLAFGELAVLHLDLPFFQQRLRLVPTCSHCYCFALHLQARVIVSVVSDSSSEKSLSPHVLPPHAEYDLFRKGVSQKGLSLLFSRKVGEMAGPKLCMRWKQSAAE